MKASRFPLSPSSVPMEHLPREALAEVAGYFQALAEPTRLQILNRLRKGECSVSELAEVCGGSVPNISRHLSLLNQKGLVARESRGTSVYYKIADESIYALCDLVCSNVARQMQRLASGRAAFIGAQKKTARK